MPDDHPPLTAVAAALRQRGMAVTYHAQAAIALRALNTDPVREWAATVPCLHKPSPCDPSPFRDYVHPECLLAALAGEAG